jgi:hypothetical protein
MATTINGTFGSEIVTEKKAIQYLTDNANVKEMRLTINVGLTELARLEQLPDIGTSNTFTFEINSVLKNFLKAKLQGFTVGSFNAENSFIFTVTGVGLNDVGTVVSGESITSNNLFAYNFSNDEISEIDLTVYRNDSAGGSNTTKLLTRLEKPRKILQGGYAYATSRLTNANLNSWYVVFTDNNLTVLSEQEIIPSGVAGALNSQYGSSLVANFSNTNATRMFLFIADNGGGAGFSKTLRSQIYSYEKVTTPCNYIELMWVNQFGSTEIWLFNTNFTDGYKVQKATFEKVRPVNPANTDRGEDIYRIESTRVFEIWSDFEEMATIKELQSIIYSPNVAIKMGTKLLPVIVENDFAENDNYFEPVNRVSFKCRLANRRINIV